MTPEEIKKFKEYVLNKFGQKIFDFLMPVFSNVLGNEEITLEEAIKDLDDSFTGDNKRMLQKSAEVLTRDPRFLDYMTRVIPSYSSSFSNSESGSFFLICGPSGAGKTTGRKNTIRDMPHMRSLFVQQYTTREIRPGEEPGFDHIFVTRERFEEMKKRGELIETYEYKGNLYGYPSSLVDRIKSGETLTGNISDLDVIKRIGQDIEVVKNAVLTFRYDLIERLLRRDDSVEERKRRIIAADRDLEEYLDNLDIFDNVIFTFSCQKSKEGTSYSFIRGKIDWVVKPEEMKEFGLEEKIKDPFEESLFERIIRVVVFGEDFLKSAAPYDFFLPVLCSRAYEELNRSEKSKALAEGALLDLNEFEKGNYEGNSRFKRTLVIAKERAPETFASLFPLASAAVYERNGNYEKALEPIEAAANINYPVSFKFLSEFKGGILWELDKPRWARYVSSPLNEAAWKDKTVEKIVSGEIDISDYGIDVSYFLDRVHASRAYNYFLSKNIEDAEREIAQVKDPQTVNALEAFINFGKSNIKHAEDCVKKIRDFEKLNVYSMLLCSIMFGGERMGLLFAKRMFLNHPSDISLAVLNYNAEKAGMTSKEVVETYK